MRLISYCAGRPEISEKKSEIVMNLNYSPEEAHQKHLEIVEEHKKTATEEEKQSIGD